MHSQVQVTLALVHLSLGPRQLSGGPAWVVVPHGDVDVGAATDVRVLARDAELPGEGITQLAVRDDHVRGVSGEIRFQVRDCAGDEAVGGQRAGEALVGEHDFERRCIESGDPAVRRGTGTRAQE
jgi:hypothetical protein